MIKGFTVIRATEGENMIERFNGVEGKRRLIDALLSQKAVHRTPEMADDLGGVVTLEEFKDGDFIVKQDGQDTDMFFILTGKVEIIVNDRVLAVRLAGEHVGEMSLIDTKARRSASVVAKEPTVVARITEPSFTGIAAKHPTLWRYLALELASRLRERNKWTRQPNPNPHIFIGSSVESLPVAREVQSLFGHDKYVVQPWTDGVFVASSTTVMDLMVQVKKADFAIMVFGADDKVISRHKQSAAPRDNVVFELGLFMGDLGPERTFIIKPRGVNLHLPTDLLGMKTLEFDTSTPANLTTALGPICHEIRKRVTLLGMK
jgi:CRP/FNR family cyclic AMP-dependent transcriptional regulator